MEIKFNRYFELTKELVYRCKYSTLRYPLELYIELNNKCNLNCVYCYKKDIRKETGNELAYKKIISILDEMDSAPPYLLVLEGGEPFLHTRIFDVLAECKNRRIYTDIITNGTTLNREDVKLLEKNFDSELFELQISLDGIGNYNYCNRNVDERRVVALIKELNQSHIRPRINTVVTKLNYKGIMSLINYLNENVQISSMTINAVFGKKNEFLKISNEEVTFLENQINLIRPQMHFEINLCLNREKKVCEQKTNASFEFMRCTALRSKLCINQDGDVYPCVFFEGNIPPIGNVENNSISSIWNSDNAECFRNKNLENSKLCRKCSFAKKCVQHCLAEES